MTPSKQAKSAGLSSLVEMSEICQVKVQTLINWHKHYPKRFNVMLEGCKVVKSGQTTSGK